MGEKLPHPERLPSEASRIYLGPWEFWRRLLGPQYKNESDLARSFLAAVDLTMVADVLQDGGKPGILDLELRFETSSIPYRFGKIAFTARDLPPLQCDRPNDAAGVVARWQQELCARHGWPSPEICVKKAAVFLTQLLVRASLKYLKPKEGDTQRLEHLFHVGHDEFVSVYDQLEPVWEMIAQVLEQAPPIIGRDVIGAMLNACVYRIQNPGRMALPQDYASELATVFPLPFILMGGDYYLDPQLSGFMVGAPYPISALGLSRDCMDLLVTQPLSEGSSTCGFILNDIECLYMRLGLGCPQRSLTDDQRKAREADKLDDWCHWMSRAVMLRTADPEIVRKWQARYSEGGW
jgi:hypothetical protein